MKKSLIALAVLAASGAAMAQSSVTLYGVVDLGLGKLDGEKVGMQSSKVTNGTSRIGFRGVEDLGGGLKVGFNFEQGINAETGAAGGYQRQANVWVGGGWGTFKMGRAFAPSYNGMAAWELLGAPNYSVVGNTYGFVGNLSARNDSQFSYKTPSFGGFGVEIGYVAKGDLGANKFDLGLTYVNGPLGAGVSYNKVSGAKANYSLGAKYNFGSFTLAASYNDGRNWEGTLANGINYNNGRRTGFSLGGMMNLGAMSFALDVTRDTKREVQVGNVVYKGKKFTNGVFEFKYALSKRTFVYADYLRLDDTNNYGVGLRHNF
ncbi:MAG: porin [Comamonadaceae bacterium]|nr:porin [Comamonadaceae bacterium]